MTWDRVPHELLLLLVSVRCLTSLCVLRWSGCGPDDLDGPMIRPTHYEIKLTTSDYLRKPGFTAEMALDISHRSPVVRRPLAD
jgi:hypothetical protein